MRKALSFLGATLGLAITVSACAQQAPDAFKGVDKSHWAYDALESLRQKNILIGYPDGYFRGKRTLTRYELAVALDRLLKNIPSLTGTPGPQGEPGPAGAPGEAGPAGPAGMVPADVDAIRRMLAEFKPELTKMGNDVNAINGRLDKLDQDVKALTERINKLPVITGKAWLGFRSDNANGGYVDYTGRINALGTNQAVLSNLQLKFAKNVAPGESLVAVVDAGNYAQYLGGELGRVDDAGASGLLSSSVPADVYLDQLAFTMPLSLIGRNSSLTVGRFAEQISPMTLWKPYIDRYFDVAGITDGKYRMDGARLLTNFGSLGVQLLGAQLSSVQGQAPEGEALNTPLAGTGGAGASNKPYSLFKGNNKPISQPNIGQVGVDQLVGISAKLPVRQFGGGFIRATALDAASRGIEQSQAGAIFPETGVWILGADTELHLTPHIRFTGDAGKTINHTGTTTNSGPNRENNAYNGRLLFRSGGINLSAGYRYIDPLFYAPGYWGHIGNWFNPVNIQGPTIHGGYDLSHNLDIHAGGEFYSAARNRASAGGIGTKDQINRVLLGVQWGITPKIETSVDWEGVYWKLAGAHAGIPAMGGGTIHPTEQYITFGTGYHITANSLFRLEYQIGDFNGHGSLTEGGTGSSNNSGVFTAQAAVKF